MDKNIESTKGYQIAMIFKPFIDLKYNVITVVDNIATGINKAIESSATNKFLKQKHYKDLRTHVLQMENNMRKGNYNLVIVDFSTLLQKLENFRSESDEVVESLNS